MEKNLRKFHFLSTLTQSLYLKKIDTCHKNPEKSSTVEVNVHTSCGYSLYTHR